jgi:hypothetical protein
MYIVHWPGKDVIACERHRNILVGLGCSMGFNVSYSLSELTVCTNCESEKRKEG